MQTQTHTHTRAHTRMQVYGTSYIKSIYTQADIVNPDSRPDEAGILKSTLYSDLYNIYIYMCVCVY